MNMKKKLVLPVLAVIAMTGVAIGASKAFASTTGYSAIVQAIATKFNLDPAQVQAVFTQNRTTQQANAETRYETFLTKAVADGKITQTQEQLILAKHKDLQANQQTRRASLKTMTAAERKATMLQDRNDLQDWAKTNDIDMTYLNRGMGRERMEFGMKPGVAQNQ